MIKAIFLMAVFAGQCLNAQAANTRTWISGKGADQASCGPIGTPCRTLQFAHDNTTPGGEIDVLDGAGYGSVTITKAINIVNDGAGVAGVLAPAGGNAITINAGPNDMIILRGLTIEGSNVGVFGVAFNSGAGLSLSNSSVQGFTAEAQTPPYSAAGVLLNLAPTGTFKFDIVNTAIENNANGVTYFTPNYQPVTSTNFITLDRVRVNSNGNNGIALGANGATTYASIRRSTISFNQYGIYLSGYATAMVDDCAVNQNGYGVRSGGSGTLILSRSSLSSNSYANGDPVSSFGDNKLNNNRFVGTIGLVALQ